MKNATMQVTRVCCRYKETDMLQSYDFVGSMWWSSGKRAKLSVNICILIHTSSSHSSIR